MEKSGYYFRLERAEIDKDYINTSKNETIVSLYNILDIVQCLRYI
jgi:hypothetical protein